MKTVIRCFVLFLVLMIFMACGDNTSEIDSAGETVVEEPIMIKIGNQAEFEAVLNGNNIPIYPNTVFMAVDQSSPSSYSSIYAVTSKDYAGIEKDFMEYYKKVLDEKLIPSGWKSVSISGTGTINLYNDSGDIKELSIMVTTADMADMNGSQEITYTINLRN